MAALCGASPTVPLAEPIPETDSSSIQSPASEMVDVTAYRHRVTLEALPNDIHVAVVRARRIIVACRPLLVVAWALVDQVWRTPGLTAVGRLVDRYTDQR